jgi:uncharacterized protein YdaU (DUF1376 family)
MDATAFGAHVRLLLIAWQQHPPCTLPDDDAELAEWARVSPEVWSQICVRVMKSWKKVRGRWRSEGLYREWLHFTKKAGQARKAADSRWSNTRNADAMRTHSERYAFQTSDIRHQTTDNILPSEVATARELLVKTVPLYAKVSDEYIAEQMAAFPTVDPVTVIDDLRAWEMDKDRKTVKPSSRLRNFFKSAAARNGQQGGERDYGF